VQEVVAEDPHEQATLIGGKWMAPGAFPDAALGPNRKSQLLEPPGARTEFLLKKTRRILDFELIGNHLLKTLPGLKRLR
jgi:hypothetical protein